MALKQRRRATYSDLGDRCGCAMGARFLAVMLIASSVWYGWHWQETLLSPWATAAHMVVFALIASGIGKLVGILLYKYRFHFS